MLSDAAKVEVFVAALQFGFNSHVLRNMLTQLHRHLVEIIIEVDRVIFSESLSTNKTIVHANRDLFAGCNSILSRLDLAQLFVIHVLFEFGQNNTVQLVELLAQMAHFVDELILIQLGIDLLLRIDLGCLLFDPDDILVLDTLEVSVLR